MICKLSTVIHRCCLCLALLHSHVLSCSLWHPPFHRKPENILLRFVDPDVVEVKVADLGLARKASNDRDQATQGLGTPMFMSPEIACGTKLNQITIMSDVFSVGASLWFCVRESVPNRNARRSFNQQEMKTAKKESGGRALELLEYSEEYMLKENPTSRAQPEKCKEVLKAMIETWKNGNMSL